MSETIYNAVLRARYATPPAGAVAAGDGPQCSTGTVSPPSPETGHRVGLDEAPPTLSDIGQSRRPTYSVTWKGNAA